MSTALQAVLDLHTIRTRTICGAISIPLVHHHGSESDAHPGPLRTVTCSEAAGHDGPHKDAVCCWSFQTFEDWQVVLRNPRAHDTCASCDTQWPCVTLVRLQAAHVAAQ